VRAWISAQPDLTLGQLQARCREQLGVRLGLNALWHRLALLGLTFKKNDARRRARSARR
jgi:transposase